ncbi:hypothetical protein M406DRAFT_358480 [Cryphonectria parasitica EP155]|uniref:DUF1711 domain-containing protein n=1 Tax=Cryphonectria parasitica (strain ATCC 38755 / EP155) TaxID=660469 RepID=A0A9P5CJ84_CRYP1|nr:uncharacterized protein M406DRAFT_358480 [Cryphonectria parasitica EP155]KAF3761104.1 hypothetical protein M406DRAFT_358480 [Cryphonectria parasitica EP155]
MAPSTSRTSTPAKDKQRKASASSSKDSKILTLKVSPDRLRALLDPAPTPTPAPEPVKEDTPVKDIKDSPGASTPQPAPASNPENVSDSSPATPANGGTPAPTAMGPPDKKKGQKRSAAAANGDGQAKVRGKPGPKKRQRMEDGTLEPARGNAHRLGPKANQGAINAGLRALDRSGKPCRKWNKGSFRLKTFTGVEWEIHRWTAPPKPEPVEATPEEVPASAAASNADSSKENKENVEQPTKSDNSNSGGDVEMQSLPSVQASSPAPMAIAAGA